MILCICKTSKVIYEALFVLLVQQIQYSKNKSSKNSRDIELSKKLQKNKK